MTQQGPTTPLTGNVTEINFYTNPGDPVKVWIPGIKLQLLDNRVVEIFLQPKDKATLSLKMPDATWKPLVVGELITVRVRQNTSTGRLESYVTAIAFGNTPTPEYQNKGASGPGYTGPRGGGFKSDGVGLAVGAAGHDAATLIQGMFQGGHFKVGETSIEQVKALYVSLRDFIYENGQAKQKAAKAANAQPEAKPLPPTNTQPQAQPMPQTAPPAQQTQVPVQQPAFQAPVIPANGYGASNGVVQPDLTQTMNNINGLLQTTAPTGGL